MLNIFFACRVLCDASKIIFEAIGVTSRLIRPTLGSVIVKKLGAIANFVVFLPYVDHNL